jgi:uncharacterized protein YndB with AHSA1/START domain
MTLPETTRSKSEARAIVVEYDVPHSTAKVWRALTDAKLLSAWLMTNEIRPVVGHRFTFQAKPMPGWDGIVQCEVLEVEVERCIRYSWRGGAESSRLDSVVTWTLTPTSSGGTRLLLEHTGFLPVNAFAYEAMSRGWSGKVGDRISEILQNAA